MLKIYNNDIVPIKVDNTNGTVSMMAESIFYLDEHSTHTVDGGIFYMPVSGGFVNYFWENNIVILHYFNKDLKQAWETTLQDIEIEHIYESGGYMIIGGSTTKAGYLGYPNPKIIVLDEKSRSITYNKVIKQKNGKVDYITSGSSGEIILGICGTEISDKDFISQLIVDKLNNNGAFENDLFDK